MKKVKSETKLYAAAVIVPAILTLLALAPFPQGIKIIGDLVFSERADHATTPAAGTGILWVRSSDNALVYTGEGGTDTALGAGGGGGAVDSVNGQTGVVSLDTDDIAEGAAKYNVTHTGQVTGATSLTVDKTAITAQTDATLATGDSIMFSDASDSGNLKEGLISQILSLISGLTVGQGGTGGSTFTDGGPLIGNGTGAFQSPGAGTAGQVLTSAGSGNDPVWDEPATGGDPTYGSEAAANDDAVFVDEFDNLGIGTTSPLEDLWIYRTDNAPRAGFQYLNAGSSGSVGPNFPDTAADNSAVGAITWADLLGLGANDSDYIIQNNAVPGGDNVTTHYLVVTDFDIDIPTGATVLGAEFVINGSYSEDDTPHAMDDAYVRIVKAGTVQTAVNRASGTTWPQSSETTRTYGGASDMWGVSLSESDVENTGFGVAFSFVMDDNDLVSLDYVTAKIYYSTGVAGDYTWTTGIDILDGAWTARFESTDWLRINPTTGATEFPGVIDVDGIKQDGVLYDLSTFGAGSGDVNGPVSSTDNAIPRFSGTGGDTIENTTVTIDDNGNVALASGDTVDGRELSTDGAKLDGIENNATADQTNAEIETAYNAQVSAVDQSTAETGSSTTIQRWTAQRVRQAASALDFTLGGDLTGTVTNVGGGLTATIADDAVTNAKLDNMAEGRWKYRRPGAGSGNPTDNTAANMVADLAVPYADGELVDLGTASTGTSTTITCPYAPGKYYVYTVTLADNATVVTSGSTLVTGNKFILIATQDGSGGNTLDFNNTYFRFSTDLPEPTIPTTASSQSIYMFMYLGGGKFSLIASNQGF